MYKSFFTALLCSTLAISCLTAQKPKTQQDFDNMLSKMYRQSVPLIHAEELKPEELDQYVILDTREWNEYQVSHIPGAQWAGYDHFQSQVLNNVSKDKPILVYCSVGYRSERIGEKLKKMGYQDVRNLYGGIFDWKNKGGTVVNSHEMPTDSVHTYNKRWSQWLFKGVKVY